MGNILERSLTLFEGEALQAEDLHLPEQTSRSTGSTEEKPLGDKMEAVEREAILKALEETRWNRTAAARKLGMTLRSLRYRLEKLGIE